MFVGFFVCLLGIIIGILPLIDGAVRFTRVPPPILYVSSGATAKFVWDYHVDDRNSEFFTTSPEWYYSNSTKKIRIAADALTLVSNKFVWIWYLSPSCPARLKPRLSKESVATLVISNVSTIDNGNYSCSLVLRAGQPPIQSTVQLIVTDGIPSPFTKVPPSVLYVVRGQDARMVWDYNVSNRNAEFGSYSPTWYYYSNTTQLQVAYEYKWNDPKWKWFIGQTCPVRLKSRVSKESTATLVISNVTTADSGIYECGLTFTSGLYKYSKVELIVTVLISSPGPLTSEVGQDVVFMVNGTAMREATWGVRDGNTEYLNPRLIKALNPEGVRPDSQLHLTSYAGRVSFVGDLSKGQAWFKITNLNINDTNTYMMKIMLKADLSRYRNIAIRLNVIQPATTVTTSTLQKSTREITATVSSSQTSPRPTTSQVPQLSNRSMSIKVVKEVLGDFSDPNSAAFKNFSNHFVSEINSIYTNIDNFEKAKVTSLSENSIPVEFVVYFKSTIKPDEICAPLKDAVKDNRLGNLKTVPGSLGCSNEPSPNFPKNQSSSACTCTSIIAVCVTVIIFLILVVVVLLIYIWRGRSNTGKGEESRTLSSAQDKVDLDVYENAHPMEETPESITIQTARTLNAEKELYETINENRDKGTATITANVKPTRGPSVGTKRDVPSLPQHYQELQRMAPNPTPLYEPLKQRDFGNKGELTSEVPKTYEQLQQNASGREYQSLKSYKADTESKV